MQPVAIIRKRFEWQAGLRPLYRALEITDDGLVLGAGTVLLARDDMRKDAADPLSSTAEQRLRAMLAAAFGRAFPASVIASIEKASVHWGRGEASLAHVHLAFAQLPRLESYEDAFRLFLADELLRDGVPPQAILKAVGVERNTPDLFKFNPYQPRVPAGQGRQSGRFGSGSGDATQPAAPQVGAAARDDTASLIQPVFYDGKTHQDVEDLTDRDRRATGTTTIEEDVEHGRPIPLAPNMVIPFAGAPPRSERETADHNPPETAHETDNEPRLCPAPRRDHGGTNKEFAIAYARYIATIVNPDEPPPPPRMGYALPVPTAKRAVIFDNCRTANGNMIEVKSRYKAMLARDSGSALIRDKWLKQLGRQLVSAAANGGRHIEWWFYDKEAATFAERIFATEIADGRVSVHQQDYPGDDRWPYPAEGR